jgi:hypothetical protein
MKPLILPPWSVAAPRSPVQTPEPRLRPIERRDPPRLPEPAIPDSEHTPLSFLDALDGQEWLRLVLWGAMGVILLIAIVSFFSAPLMGPDIVIVSGLLAALLVTSYAY